jgi:hypothetical protein
MILQLQTRKSSTDEWGILNTVKMASSTEKAQEEIESLRNRWLGNYDPTLQFRVVSL